MEEAPAPWVGPGWRRFLRYGWVPGWRRTLTGAGSPNGGGPPMEEAPEPRAPPPVPLPLGGSGRPTGPAVSLGGRWSQPSPSFARESGVSAPGGPVPPAPPEGSRRSPRARRAAWGRVEALRRGRGRRQRSRTGKCRPAAARTAQRQTCPLSGTAVPWDLRRSLGPAPESPRPRPAPGGRMLASPGGVCPDWRRAFSRVSLLSEEEDRVLSEAGFGHGCPPRAPRWAWPRTRLRCGTGRSRQTFLGSLCL